jgi:NAD+ kinase
MVNDRKINRFNETPKMPYTNPNQFDAPTSSGNIKNNMRVAIFGSIYSRDKLPLLLQLLNKLRSMNAEVFVDHELAQLLADIFNPIPEEHIWREGDVHPVDVAISIGGDGAFLRTAARIRGLGAPIFGVNAGRLGFLADAAANEMEAALDEIAEHRYEVEERTLLELAEGHESLSTFNFALNEVAVLKRDTSSMLTIYVSINSQFLATYMADGLIVATPTGSTAYSLSVNGPIIVPQSSSLVISPIAPHSLNVRPLVIPDDSIISLTIESRSEYFLVALDGRSEMLPAGSKLTVAKAMYKVKVLKRNGHTFFSTLRDKLMWGTDARY